MSQAIIDSLLLVWRRNGKRAQDLFANIPDDRLADQSHGLKNHPAWTLSHLIHYHRPILSLARGEVVEDPAKSPGAETFGNGSKPVPDPAYYLSRVDLIDRFTRNHEEIEAALMACHDPIELFESDPGLERWEAAFGKRGSALMYMMIYHESHHLAEIADWKKVSGIPVVAKGDLQTRDQAKTDSPNA